MSGLPCVDALLRLRSEANPATYSDEGSKSGRLRLGMGGRFASEWVAAFNRNGWPGWLGICNLTVEAMRQVESGG